MLTHFLTFIGALAFSSHTLSRATGVPSAVTQTVLNPNSTAAPAKSAGPGSLPTIADVDHLKVQRIRIEAAILPEPEPSATVKFDLVNDGPVSLSDIVLEVSLIDTTIADDDKEPRRVRAGPYSIRGDIVLLPGYALNYEMKLRNVSVDCACTAKVEVISARSAWKAVTPRW